MQFPTTEQTAQLDAIRAELTADSDPVLNELGRTITPLQLILLLNAMDRARGDRAGAVDNLAELLADHSGLSDDLEVAQDMGLFRHLSETETAEFKQWAWDNYTPGDIINPAIHHPVVVAECQLIKAAADAWQKETESAFYREWDRQADRDESDDYWGSFEHDGDMYDFCAYWTQGNFAVLVYKCVRDPGVGNWQGTLNMTPDLATCQHLPLEGGDS